MLFWDNLLGYSLPLEDCINKAKKFIRKYPETGLPELKQDTTFQEWSEKEGYPLAIKYVYLNGSLNYTVKGKGERFCFNGSPLPPNYHKNAYALAEKRVVLAGIRISNYLITIYK